MLLRTEYQFLYIINILYWTLGIILLKIVREDSANINYLGHAACVFGWCWCNVKTGDGVSSWQVGKIHRNMFKGDNRDFRWHAKLTQIQIYENSSCYIIVSWF